MRTRPFAILFSLLPAMACGAGCCRCPPPPAAAASSRADAARPDRLAFAVLVQPYAGPSDTLGSTARLDVTLVNQSGGPLAFTHLYGDGHLFVRLGRRDPLGQISHALAGDRGGTETMVAPEAYGPRVVPPGGRLTVRLEGWASWGYYQRGVRSGGDPPDPDGDAAGGEFLLRAAAVGWDAKGTEVAACSDPVRLSLAPATQPAPTTSP